MGKYKKDEPGTPIWGFITGLFSVLTIVFLIFLFVKQKGVIKNESVKKSKPFKKISGLNNRQEKVLNLLKSKREITVDEALVDIKDVSERTLRRDMNKLESLGISKKEGTTKGSKYIYIQK